MHICLLLHFLESIILNLCKALHFILVYISCLLLLDSLECFHTFCNLNYMINIVTCKSLRTLKNIVLEINLSGILDKGFRYLRLLINILNCHPEKFYQFIDP